MIRPLLFLFALVVALPAHADDPPRAFQGQDDTVYPEFEDAPADAPTARLRIVFDQVGRSQEIAAEPMQPFDVYVMGYDVQISLQGWEARILVDERLKILEKNLTADINVGSWPEVSAALKPSSCESGDEIVLGHLKLMLTEPAKDLVLGLAPISRPSAPSDPEIVGGPTPVYIVCRPEPDIRPFDYCETCAVVNPDSVRPERDEDAGPSATELFGIDRDRQ